MLHDPELLDAIEALVGPTRREAVAWRQTFSDRDPLIPNSRGARWNPPGVDALYCSLSEHGAAAEHARVISQEPVTKAKPLRMVRLRLSLGKVADLRNAEGLKELGFGPNELTGEDWGPAQVVGAAAAWLGIAAVVVPSARHTAGNIVVFVNNIGPDDLVDVDSESS
jgi:RES domain-containing protein